MVQKKHLRIIRRILPTKFIKIQRMELTDGKLDYLGQILHQWQYTIPEGARVPSDLEEEIPYLTLKLRGKIIDTPLTYEILKLDTLPRDVQEHKLELLLSDVGLKVSFE